jgi:peptide deformylase
MALLSILQFPDKKLRNKALPVTQFDDQLKRTIDDMFETMYEQSGVGLAAIQVAVPLRVIVIDVSDDKSAPLCLINPEIIYRDGVQEEMEGCLSFPGVYDKVDRALTIRVRTQDPHGEFFEMAATDLLSVCIQHEMDHLDGILFIDHLSRLKQARLRKKLDKIRSRTF